MKFETILGFIAATLTTSSFIPQVIKTWRLKETKDISLVMYSLLAAGILLWIIYGLMIWNLPLIFSNSISLTLTLILIFFKLKFK